jgi:O-antigen/teichoic acid export membrane protein
VQDFVLTGFGAARWTPLENITFSTIKLLLLFVLSPLGTAAVVLSWVLPAALGVVVVTSILARSRRCHAQGEPRLPQPRSLVTHIAGEYTAAVLATGSQYLLPLLIVHRLGPETFAYFTVPWLVITSVSMLLWNVATSVTAEASRSLDQAHALLRRAAYLTAAVAVSSTVVVVCGAPLLLAMVGRGYSEVGVVPLQLAALGLPFMVVPLLWSTLARLRRRPSLIAWSQGLAGGLSVVGALVLMPSLGLRGVALSFAGAQAIAAIVLFPGVRRGFRDLSSAARVIDLERLDPTVANVRG